MKVLWKYYRHSTSIKNIIIKERERERGVLLANKFEPHQVKCHCPLELMKH